MTLAVNRHILHHVLKTLCMSDVILFIKEVNGLVTAQVTISLHRRQTETAGELANEDNDVFCFVYSLLCHRFIKMFRIRVQKIVI